MWIALWPRCPILLLQLSRIEFDAFLMRRNIDAHAYDIEDLEQDVETVERLEASGLMPRS